jgi:regulator of protease activity HflC (stomatin/prohibitin superfamily)
LLCFASPHCSPMCGLCCCLTCVSSSEYGVMQRFGKFDRFLHPGMHFVKWPMER